MSVQYHRRMRLISGPSNHVILLCLYLAFALIPGSGFAGEAKNNYLELQGSKPAVEKRLSNWRERSVATAEILLQSTDPAIFGWQQLVNTGRILVPYRSDHEFLSKMNARINQSIRYISDYRHYDKADFWADPPKTLIEGGDCEDIALVKAATLAFLGWPTERKHLLVGMLHRANGKDEPHAVLMIEFADSPPGEHWVLDSTSETGNQLINLADFNFTAMYSVGSKPGLRLFMKTRPKKNH